MTAACTNIDWTDVVNFDSYGSVWGTSTVTDAEELVEQAQADGDHIDEWHVAAHGGLPIRIVRIADPEFLDTICVFPAECPDCGSPVTTLAWVSDEHHPKCPHRDPYF